MNRVHLLFMWECRCVKREILTALKCMAHTIGFRNESEW